MKNGIAYGFLILTIIAILLAITVSPLIAQTLNLNTRATEAYQYLADSISSVKDGQIESTTLHMDKKSVIVGFAKGSNRFENHGYLYINPNPDYIVSIFNRPQTEECEINKACICLCKGYELEKKSYPFTPTCKKISCRPFDNIDFFSERVTSRESDDRPRSSWKGGFMFGKDVPIEANDVIQNQFMKRDREQYGTIYVQRHKNIVDVCLVSPCISVSDKEQIAIGGPSAVKQTNAAQCGGAIYGNCAQGSCVKESSGDWVCSSRVIQNYGCYKIGTVNEVICTSQPGCADIISQCRPNSCASYPECTLVG